MRHISHQSQAGDWQSTARLMKHEMRRLTAHPASTPFRASSLPDCILHVSDALTQDIPFKDFVNRASVAGACGLDFLRGSELVSTVVTNILKKIKGIPEDTLAEVTDLLVAM